MLLRVCHTLQFRAMRHDELSEFAITVVGSSGICHRALHILCSSVGGLGAVTDGNVSANVVRNYCCRGADRRVKSLIELAERISGFCRVSRPLSPRRHTHTHTRANTRLTALCP